MIVTSSAGSPTVSNTITMVTKPACGIPAAPILAAVAVMAIAIVWPKKIFKSINIFAFYHGSSREKYFQIREKAIIFMIDLLFSR